MSKQERPKGWLIDKQQVDTWLGQASHQIRDRKYEKAVRTCKRILRYLPKRDKVRAETLGLMGVACAMDRDIAGAYQYFDQALKIDKENAYFWYNFGLACLQTSRTGRAFVALERAVDLEGNGEMADDFSEKLELSRQIVQSELELRGPDFSIEQLVEQQDFFADGIQLSSKGQWGKAEKAYRKAISLGDCLPQPWGNLGICLMMQKRFDEAETAFDRALEMDPEYELAQTNLGKLQHMRENPDFEPEFRLSNPFDSMDTSLTIIEED